jgi:hypothetical protein
LYEGNEFQGKAGKQYWLIARRCIAIAMDQGGSVNIGSQIFPEFVQAQMYFSIMPAFRDNLLNSRDHQYGSRLRAICGFIITVFR